MNMIVVLPVGIVTLKLKNMKIKVGIRSLKKLLRLKKGMRS